MTARRIELRSGHCLVDSDYEARIVAALLRDQALARAATAPLDPDDFGHPHFAAIFAASRSIDARGQAPTIPAVREHLVARGIPAAVAFIAIALDNYIPSADGPRLRFFCEKIRKLAELRRLLALADRIDLLLADQRLGEDSRIDGAHELIRESLAGLAVEPLARRAA
jgi:hypothetical protein